MISRDNPQITKLAGSETYVNAPELEVLIRDCISQHPVAQKKLYLHVYGFVKSICLRYTNKIEDCEEVMDDSFLKMFRNLDKYNFEKPFIAWLRTIVVNTAIDYYRHAVRTPASDGLEDYHHVSMDDHTISNLSVEEILKAVHQLSPAYRTVFMMYVIDGYSHKEIAESLSITEGTSKSNLSKARCKLQELLQWMYGQEEHSELMKYTLPSNL